MDRNLTFPIPEGFRAMVGETLSLKKDSVFYYLHAYWRREGEDARPVLKEIFRSFKWE